MLTTTTPPPQPVLLLSSLLVSLSTEPAAYSNAEVLRVLHSSLLILRCVTSSPQEVRRPAAESRSLAAGTASSSRSRRMWGRNQSFVRSSQSRASLLSPSLSLPPTFHVISCVTSLIMRNDLVRLVTSQHQWGKKRKEKSVCTTSTFKIQSSSWLGTWAINRRVLTHSHSLSHSHSVLSIAP